jgi:phage tail sheath gpL-like
MSLPTAVSPSNPVPGVYANVALLYSAQGPGLGTFKVLLISPPASVGGNIGVNTEIRSVSSADDIELAAGKCLGWFAYKALLEAYPDIQVDLVCPAESAGAAATQTLVFGGAPTTNCAWDIYISEEKAASVVWAVGDSATVAQAAAVIELAKTSSRVFCLATGATATVTLTARGKGPAGNDITVRVVQTAGAGGTLTPGGSKLAGGTTEPDVTTALGLIGGRRYTMLLPCLSNADATSGSSSGNVKKCTDYVASVISGRNARLEQMVVASTLTYGAAKTGATAGNGGGNNPNLQHICSRNDGSLPCVLAAAELGDRLFRRSTQSSANRIGSYLKTIKGSPNWQTDMPSDIEAADLLNSGVSPVSYDASGAPISLRPITTHYQDSSGNQDRRCFDVNEVDGIYDTTADVAVAVQQEYMTPGQQVKISPDLAPDAQPDDLPEGVVEERDIRATVSNRMRFWIRKGVIDKTKWEAAAVPGGAFKVKINASDPTQVDCFLPLACFKNFAKFSLYAAKVG